jgi:hypothetical protein
VARSILIAALIFLGACVGPVRELGTFSIEAVGASQLAGTATARMDQDGDLVLAVSVHGPPELLTRIREGNLEPNLIWHLVEGDCAAWRSDGNRNEVLARWSTDPQSGDTNNFGYTVGKAHLGDTRRAHALIAFRNGGGPLYACGNLPGFPV